MASILLIRHAETELNASRIVQFPDTPLNRRGLWQAKRLAARLSDVGVVQVISSDYLRARTTAEHICAVTHAPLTLDRQLRERNLGTLRGLPYTDIHKQVFQKDWELSTGENWTEFHQRIASFWYHLREVSTSINGRLALVTHGLVCKTIVREHLALTEPAHPLHFPNASVTIIKAEPPWSVQVLASDTHLHSSEHT